MSLVRKKSLIRPARLPARSTTICTRRRCIPSTSLANLLRLFRPRLHVGGVQPAGIRQPRFGLLYPSDVSRSLVVLESAFVVCLLPSPRQVGHVPIEHVVPVGADMEHSITGILPWSVNYFAPSALGQHTRVNQA